MGFGVPVDLGVYSLNFSMISDITDKLHKVAIFGTYCRISILINAMLITIER